MKTVNCGRCGNAFSYSDDIFASSPRIGGGFFGLGRLCSVCAAAEDSETASERERSGRERNRHEESQNADAREREKVDRDRQSLLAIEHLEQERQRRED